MSGHSAPLYCCYCGGEDLFPHAGEEGSQPGTQHGTWECRGCLRVFRVSMVGLLAPPTTPGGVR